MCQLTQPSSSSLRRPMALRIMRLRLAPTLLLVDTLQSHPQLPKAFLWRAHFHKSGHWVSALNGGRRGSVGTPLFTVATASHHVCRRTRRPAFAR